MSNEFIGKLGADMKTLTHVCTKTLQEITPRLKFSLKSFETHVRVSAIINYFLKRIKIVFSLY